MGETMVATAGATLPEDVILEILARLEEASTLFRCAVTCRRWRALVAEPSFLRRRWPHPCFVGFLTREWRRGEGVSFLPVPGSALGASRRLLRSYIPDAPGLSGSVRPLASHNGLLLVPLFPSDPATLQLAVCDPLAGTWDVLPALRLNGARYFSGFAIVTGAGCCSSESASFRVLIVRTEKHGAQYILHALSSGQPSWSAPTKFPGVVEYSLREAAVMHTDGVVCNGGAAHWLFANLSEFHILGINPQTGGVASTQLLIPLIPGNLHRRICLTTTVDGTMLSLCAYDGDRRVEIWAQQHDADSGDGNVRWLRTKVIELKLMEQLEEAWCMCLGGRSGRLLIMDCHLRVYVLDLIGGAMEEMKYQFYDSNLSAVPMEIDWPVFFMSRLRLI